MVWLNVLNTASTEHCDLKIAGLRNIDEQISHTIKATVVHHGERLTDKYNTRSLLPLVT